MESNNRQKRLRPSADISTMVYGKIPPQAKDLEEAILGGILLEKDAFDTVNSMLRPDCFYVDGHQCIFKAMQQLAAKSQPIDSLTVEEELRKAGQLEIIGGPFFLKRLTSSVVSSANIEAHCRIVLQKFIQREIIRISGELISTAYEDACDPMELLEEAEQQLTGINSSLSFGDMLPIDTVLVQAIQQIEEWRNRPDKSEVTGIRTGNKRLDMVTRGWQPGDFIIIAARPSVGKTAFALNIVKAAGEHLKEKGGTVAIFSLEMAAVRLILRMLAATSQVWLMKIQTGNLTEADMKQIYRDGVQVMSRLGVLFDDKQSLTVAKLKNKCRKMKRKNKLGLVVIDYLQLMTPEERNGRNREQEISKISRDIKNLAQELSIPIIALSQLSREVEKRSGTEPQPSDLRESGSLEQDADLILFLYNYTDAEKAENRELENRVRVKIGKQRDGMLDKFDIGFEGTIQRFTEISQLETGLNSNWKPVSSIPTVKSFYEKDEETPF